VSPETQAPRSKLRILRAPDRRKECLPGLSLETSRMLVGRTNGLTQLGHRTWSCIWQLFDRNCGAYAQRVIREFALRKPLPAAKSKRFLIQAVSETSMASLSTESGWQSDTLLTPVRMEPLTSAQSDTTAGAGNRKLHVPTSSRASSGASRDVQRFLELIEDAGIFANVSYHQFLLRNLQAGKTDRPEAPRSSFFGRRRPANGLCASSARDKN
jgi:hypothetical protein